MPRSRRVGEFLPRDGACGGDGDGDCGGACGACGGGDGVVCVYGCQVLSKGVEV